MAANNSPGATGSRTHPAIIVAAVAVTAFAIVGTAAVMGWLPKAGSSPTSFASSGQQAAGGSSAEYPVPPAPEEKAPEPVKAAPRAAPAPAPAAAPKPAPATAAKPAPKPQQQAQKAPAQKPQTASPAAAQPSTPNYSDRAPVAVATNAPPPAPTPAPIICRNCGTITAITPVEKAGEASGAGAVLGGIVGGVLGHQVGGGRGKDVATVAGAVGGAYAGHQIEKSKSKNVTWDVHVKLEDGTSQTVRYAQEPAFRVGDKVKLEGNALVRG